MRPRSLRRLLGEQSRKQRRAIERKRLERHSAEYARERQTAEYLRQREAPLFGGPVHWDFTRNTWVTR